MAWTTQGPRFDGKSLKVVDTPDNLGPGAYGAHEQKAPHPSMAPFNSSGNREQTVGVPSLKEAAPPPGAYDPKLPAAYDAGLPRKHVPFLGGTDRADVAVKTCAPGPGQYHGEPSMQVLPCRTIGPPEVKKVMVKNASAPSIPRGHQCFGYDEVGNGRLTMQGPKDGKLYLTGETRDSAGPGHYQGHMVSAHLPNPAGGRFLGGAARATHVAPEAPGPGHYVAHKPRESGCYSSFVSGSTQRPEKSRRNLKKSMTPGPGSYSRDMQSAPSLREQHPELQYFGSTSERFKEAPMAKGPGPGTYVARQRVLLKSSWGASDRFGDGAPRDVPQPGPGSYDPATTDGKTTGPLGSTSLLASTGCAAFGSMESRQGVGGRGAATAPGPGAYTTVEYEPPQGARGQDTRSRLKKTPKPVSTSAVAEWGAKEVKDSYGPPPGAYDPVHIRDTACVMRLPPKGEGFLSGGSRLAAAPKRGSEPDPGSYNADPGLITGGKRTGTFNRTVLEGAPETGRPRGLGFGNQSSRFKRDKGAATAPGPGAYKTDKNWTKKNYNIHFGDI